MKVRAVVFSLAVLAGMSLVGPSAALAQGHQFFAILLGGNEVDGAGYADAGDQNGFGAVSLIIAGTRICYGIVVHNIDEPNAAHIHDATAGENSGPFITLKFPKRGNRGHVSGCVAATANQRNAIKAGPNKFYINVHTGDFPDGALRGQLF